jgi:molecular chaperone HtpG
MIALPSTLASLLEKDPALDGLVKLVVSKYDDILRWSTLPFFPEYTDHGPRHLSEVLQTFSDLITPDSWTLLTPQDAAASVFSVLFHDLGMHIAEDGFFALTDPHNLGILIPQIDSHAWPNLWEDFVAEARRFDQKRLTRMFGDTLPVSVPPRNCDLLTGRDRKLIGEFIRRHHPRLAHEFALFGFQGSAKRINVVSEAPQDLLDISGLIARSHGSELREFLPYLEKRYSSREYKHIHPTFLMALLRVSDYLQIQAARAPEVRLDVQNVGSPFSLREWRTHGAVIDVIQYHDDPESIYVRTKPPDPEVYLHLKTLMSSLQNELDSCWAVLGEVYGRFPPLNKLGLTLRRIRSDLDETDTKASPGEFVQGRFSFESAGGELLKLLAEPLYGRNPTFAVRELIQNAVDAVLEMEAIREKTGQPVPTREQEADVEVSLDGSDANGYTLRVADKGVGMNRDVLQNYFLKAGASYRRSSEWQKDFVDSSGHAKVLRSGRFGIGVLAAFMLGSEISVRTRHYSQQYGLSFSARLETDPIDVRYCEIPVGTEIKIKVAGAQVSNLKNMFDAKMGKEQGFGSLPAGLYFLSRPSLALRLNGQKVNRSGLWPSCREDPLPPGWNRIRPRGFEEVQWRYEQDPDFFTSLTSMVACNGIAIARPGKYTLPFWQFKEGEHAIAKRPTLSVFDPDGYLALRLDRTSLAVSHLPFERELVRDIYRDAAAYCLAAFAVDGEAELQIRNGWIFDHPAFSSTSGPSFLFLENGFTLLDPKLAVSQSLHTINSFSFPPRDFTLPRPHNGEGTSAHVLFKRSARARDKVARDAVMAVRGSKNLHGYRVVGARLMCTEDMWRQWKRRISKYYLRHLSEEATFEGCVSLTLGKCLSPTIPLSLVANATNSGWIDSQMVVTQFYVAKSSSEPADSLISRAFYEDIGSPIVPYTLSERRKLAGYDSLHRQIEFHKNRLRSKAEEKTRTMGRVPHP